MRKDIKRQVAATVIALVACVTLSSCSNGTESTPKQLKLEGVEAYTGMGESRTKALKALEDIRSFVSNQVTKGVPIEKISLDSMNLNMRLSTIVGPDDAAKFYGGLPNVASVKTGSEFLAAAPSGADVCLYLKLTTVNGSLVSQHGVSRDSFCRAGDPITDITWATAGSAEWPDASTTKLPSLAEYKAYATRHPGESVIPEGYTDDARTNKPGQTAPAPTKSGDPSATSSGNGNSNGTASTGTKATAAPTTNAGTGSR